MSSRVVYVGSSLSKAVGANLFSGHPRRRRYLHALARQPLESAAAETLAALPEVAVADLVDIDVLPPLAPGKAWGGRGSWSLGLTERLVLQALVVGRGVRTAFEIGTYNGGTTALIAESLPPDGRVVTLDLPPEAFDRSQSPVDLDGHRVGERWRASPAADRVEQVLCDSLEFDPSPWEGRCDLVLVDGAHDLVHGRQDSRTALRLVRPGGIVVWDDFTPYWTGLIRGIVEGVGGGPLARLAGTDLGVLVQPALDPAPQPDRHRR